MQDALLTPENVTSLFQSADGGFRFARWARPIAPVVFGVDDVTLGVVKDALQTLAAVAGHDVVETDPEMGANLMFFFLRDWSELVDVPDLDHLIPELATLVPKLQEQSANQYRMFRFESDGAIRASFVFLRMDEELSVLPAQTLALAQIVQIMLLWGNQAFASQSPLAHAEGIDVIRPDIAELVRAAYDPVLPNAAIDPSHGMRLYARMTKG